MTVVQRPHRRLNACLPLIALAALLGATAAACGGDHIPNDPRVNEIAAFVTAAADRYSAMGNSGLFDFLEERTKMRCPRDVFVQALVGHTQGMAYRQLKSVSFNSDNTADVKIDFITNSGDEDVTWKLIRLPNGSWRILDVPGMEACPTAAATPPKST